MLAVKNIFSLYELNKMINYANRGQKIDMIRINNKSGTVIELCKQKNNLIRKISK